MFKVGRVFVVVLSFAMAGAASAAEAPEAADVVKSLFGADLARVKATRDADDDLELAGRLLNAARDVVAQPDLVALLCEKACDLAEGQPAGYETALEALSLLSLDVPERSAECAARALPIRQKQFDASRGAGRAAAGDALLDALLAAADAQSGAGEPAEAATLYKRAQGVARAVGSPRLDEVDGRLKSLANALRASREIGLAKKQLEVDPKNQVAREKLARLYLVDLDNPARAAAYLNYVDDVALKKYVPAAAKPVEVAPELACFELAEWYRVLAESAAAGAKAAMYARARSYYQRFLDLHEAEDLQRTTATMALKKVDEELAKLAPQAFAGWTWLFRGKDLGAWESAPGAWKVERGVMTGNAPAKGGVTIWTKETFADFTLELDFVLSRKASGGIFVRAGNLRRPGMSAFEVYLADSAHIDLPGKHTCGALWECLAPARVAVRPAGQWNHIAVSCRGSRMTVVLNGARVVDTNLALWVVPGRNPDRTRNSLRVPYRAMPREGPIVLESREGVVGFRNIRIRQVGP